MFGSVGLFSLVYVPRLISSKASSRGGGNLSFLVAGSSFFTSLPWLLFGALLLAVQALAMYSAIGLFGSATMTNILYGSRCLWSVLLVWVLGAMAGDSLTSQGRVGVMTRRLIGALLLLGAMTLVLE